MALRTVTLVEPGRYVEAQIDAIADLVDGWLGEARRDEQERIKAGIKALPVRLPAELAYKSVEPYAWINRSVVLGVIEGSDKEAP